MQKIAMTTQIMQVLKPALLGAQVTIKSEIKRGISHLYTTNNGNLFLVLRAEGSQLVIVAIAGQKLKESRQEIINFIKARHYKTVRFHTKYPERLEHAMHDLPVRLIEVRKALLGKDELIYQLDMSEV